MFSWWPFCYYNLDNLCICTDPETKELIKKILSIGHVSYEVLLPVCSCLFSNGLPKIFLLAFFNMVTESLELQVRFLDMWEPAVLAIKREGYSIKCNGQRGVVVTEKFQQATVVCFL
jgi:hypothetical protein